MDRAGTVWSLNEDIVKCRLRRQISAERLLLTIQIMARNVLDLFHHGRKRS